MTSDEINELLEEAKCFTCLGVSLTDALRLALLARIQVSAETNLGLFDEIYLVTADQSTDDSGTFEDVTQLAWPVEAGVMYEITGFLKTGGTSATSDGKIRIVIPSVSSNVTGGSFTQYFNVSNSWTTNIVSALAGTPGYLYSTAGIGLGVTVGEFSPAKITAALTSSTSGTAQFQFALNSALAGQAFTIKAGSYIALRRIG